MPINSSHVFFPAGTQNTNPKPGDQWAIPDFLKHNTATWATTLAQVYAHPMSFPGSVSPAMGNLLRALLMNIAPRKVVEIGSYIGVSTLWIASAMQEYRDAYHSQLHCIDIFPDHTHNPWHPGKSLIDPYAFVSANVEACGFSEFVTLHKGRSEQVIDQLIADGLAPVDFVFIDGDHTPEGCLRDFQKIAPYVTAGGYILFHDVFPEFCGVDGPAYTLSHYIKHSPDYEYCNLYTAPLNFGFAIVRVKT